MPFAVEQDEALHPAEVSLVGANTIMLKAESLADLVE